mgnify:FL=1
MERFNTSIVCTYNLLKDDDESELCYKIQYLDIFGLKDYDGDIINKVIQDLENKYKDNEYIKRLIDIKTAQEKQIAMFSKENLDFVLCFQYEKFYIIHYLLSCLINNNKIDDEKFENMLKKINK